MSMFTIVLEGKVVKNNQIAKSKIHYIREDILIYSELILRMPVKIFLESTQDFAFW